MVCITWYYAFRDEGDGTGRRMLLSHPEHSHEVRCHTSISLTWSLFLAPSLPLSLSLTHPPLTTDSPVPVGLVMICCSRIQDCQGLTIGRRALFDSQYGNTHFS